MRLSIEIHCCAGEESVMSFPMGGLCVKTSINTFLKEKCTAALFEHTLQDSSEASAKLCADRKPWAVGLSLYIWNYEWFIDFAKKLKSLDSSIIIFAGGPQVMCFDEVPSCLDFITQGEGELNVVDSLKKCMCGEMKKGTIVPASLPDLNNVPSVFLSGQADGIMSGCDSVLWEMTRGCPFGCAFCFESRGEKTVRDFPMDRISAELDYLVKSDVQNVFVLDPTFNLNKERAKQILEMLIDRSPSHIHYTFEIRAELIDEEMAVLFATLNCSLQIGLQSANKSVLEKIGRSFDRNLFAQKVKLLQKNGVSYGIDIIIGLPEDNLQSFRDTVNFVVSLQPSNIDCFVLSVLPGTALEKCASDFGLVTDNTPYHNVVSTPTFLKQEIESACNLRAAMDLFYTKGQSCMWIHCILETLNITACNLFMLFGKWFNQTNRNEDEDIWLLQDEFIASLFEKTQNTKLLSAMKSFMELHQGLCYVTDTGEEAQLDLCYLPDELALLDTMSLKEFVKTHKPKKCNPVLAMEEGEIIIR